MNRAIATISLCVLLTSPASGQSDPPDVVREFRAVWVATVSNIDWPSRPGLSAWEQQAELIAIMNRTVALNMNAVILQVRPATDALYKSDLEPWSEYLSSQMGRPPEPYYDPLEFAVAEAHKRGLELHAWFNPYRSRHPSAKSEIAATHLSNTKPELVRTYGKHLWLDPGDP
ncbi:MAG: family 10 glycosylhydrolase, partial [Gemmatimonadaceae bacterium]|nr:family 10 glycosylhydrolase [Gemmatimonadaceae bacterium]